jgi:glycosyltransferase involved in cell wall biosynthesis
MTSILGLNEACKRRLDDGKFTENSNQQPCELVEMQNQTKPTKLAVIFPVYNGAKTLEKSLQCIADQDYRDFRAYIVENRSTDGSLEIARAFSAKDARFEVIQCEDHLGMTENFMRAIKIGSEKGEYFCLRACDDLSTPDYVSKLLIALESNPDKLIAVASTRRISTNNVQTIKPTMDTLSFLQNVTNGKVPKGLFFPSEWFYGVVRADGGAEIFLERWPKLHSPWCAASYTIAEFVMRDRVVWVDGPFYDFSLGSDSYALYTAKSLSTKIRQRWIYTIGCYRVIDKLPKLPLWTRIAILRMCWKDAGRKLQYRIRKHLMNNIRRAF